MKKIIIISIFILAVIFLAFLLYLVFLKPTIQSPITEPEQEITIPTLPISRDIWERMTIEERGRLSLPLYQWPEETQPIIPLIEPEEEISPVAEIAQGGLTWVYPLSDESSQAAVLSNDGHNAFYYNQETGKFYEITQDGDKKVLTDETFPNAEKVTWSPVKDKAILEFPDGFKVMYDFKTNKKYTLPKEWYEFSFNQSGREIAFKTASNYTEDRWLAIANPDGTGAKAIEHMGDNADKVIVSYSPNNQVIAFSRTGEPRGTFEQDILLIGKYGESIPSLLVDGRDFEPIWSPRGNKILYSVYSEQTNYKPTLYITGSEESSINQNKKALGVGTWAHKCTIDYSEKTAYCAVPVNLPEGSGLVRELAYQNKDIFYKIDLESGQSTLLAEGAFGNYRVEQVFLSQDESILYFVDRDLNKLRYLKLK